MALAGVRLETSFARFMASMAASNKVITFSRRFCRLESASMVEGGGNRERTVLRWLCGRTRTLIQMTGRLAVPHLVQATSFDEIRG